MCLGDARGSPSHFIVQEKAGQGDLALKFECQVGNAFESVVRNDERNDAAVAQSSWTLVTLGPVSMDSGQQGSVFSIYSRTFAQVYLPAPCSARMRMLLHWRVSIHLSMIDLASNLSSS